jgi:hypothetical protein
MYVVTAESIIDNHTVTSQVDQSIDCIEAYRFSII